MGKCQVKLLKSDVKEILFVGNLKRRPTEAGKPRSTDSFDGTFLHGAW
jgi:hypothetical protein